MPCRMRYCATLASSIGIDLGVYPAHDLHHSIDHIDKLLPWAAIYHFLSYHLIGVPAQVWIARASTNSEGNWIHHVLRKPAPVSRQIESPISCTTGRSPRHSQKTVRTAVSKHPAMQILNMTLEQLRLLGVPDSLEPRRRLLMISFRIPESTTLPLDA
jgi:hypothetical protein